MYIKKKLKLVKIPYLWDAIFDGQSDLEDIFGLEKVEN